MTQTKAELLETKHQGALHLGDANSSNYVGLKAPATVSSNIVWTLPAADGTANYLLKTDGSGNLGWVADSTTDSTKMPLSGGTFTGDVTFQGDSSNGLWDKSANAFVANLTGNVTGNCSGTSGGFTAGNASNLNSGTVNVARLGSGSSVTTKFLRGDNTWQTISSTPEGTAILSTGESGGTKFLREDGDGTCSWQTATTSAAGSNTQIQYNNSGAFAGLSTLTTDGSDITLVGASSKNFLWDTSAGELKASNNTKLSFGAMDGNGGLTLWDHGTAGYIQQTQDNCAIIFGVSIGGAFKTTIVTDAGASGSVACYYNGNKKWETTNTGTTTTGTCTATTFSGSGASLTNVNATTLDSIDSGSFLRSDTSDTLNGVLTIDNGTSGANAFIVKNDEVGLNLAPTGTGDTNPREVIFNATRIDSGSLPNLRLGGQGGIKFCVDANTERLRIGTSGQIGIAGANYGSSGQVLTSQGGSAAPQWATVAGGMPIHTANGTSVGVGEAFLITSTSTLPSQWSYSSGYFYVTHSTKWVGIFNSRLQGSSFKGGWISHNWSTSGTVSITRHFWNGSSLSSHANLDSYLPVLVIRLG